MKAEDLYYCIKRIENAKMGDLPKKYKAVVYDKPGSVSTKVVELDMPEPGLGEVLINLYERPDSQQVVVLTKRPGLTPVCATPTTV